jgi:hypothetical protein
MFQKTFIRLAITVAFTFTVAILLMAFQRSQSGCVEAGKPAETSPVTHYGEYIIWESLSSTALSIN